MFNHWLGSQCLNTGRIRVLYCEFQCGKFGVARVLPRWPLLKPLVVTIFQKLKEIFGRASERISSDRGKGIRQSNAREKEENLAWSSGQIDLFGWISHNLKLNISFVSSRAVLASASNSALNLSRKTKNAKIYMLLLLTRVMWRSSSHLCVSCLASGSQGICSSFLSLSESTWAGTDRPGKPKP